MDAFDEKAYVAEVLIPAADRFCADGSLPDVFSRFGLALDVHDEGYIEARIEQAKACWRGREADPICAPVLGVLLDAEELRRARRILADPVRRAAERAAIAQASRVSVSHPSEELDAAAGSVSDQTLSEPPLERQAESARLSLAKVPPAPPVMAPEPVPSVTIALRDGAIVVEWAPSPTTGEVTYEVSRSTGGAWGQGKGDILTFTSHTSYLDHDVRAGERYAYRVTAMRNDLRASFTSAPDALLVTQEVSSCDITAESQRVRASWRVPSGASLVVVHRCETDASSQTWVLVAESSRLDGFDDDQVSNGITYTYRIQAEYDDPQGAQRTPGIVVTARPEAPPRPVEVLVAEARDRDVLVSWTAPPTGEVRVFRTATDPRWACGALVAPGELAQNAVPLQPEKSTAAVDLDPSCGVVYYVPATVVGARAVVGRALRFVHLPDVRDLEIEDFGGYLQLRWQWPSSCARARVSWRSDQFPTHGDDPAATHVDVSRSEYENRGGFRVSQPDRAPYWFTVYASAFSGDDLLFSHGAHEGCRVSCHREEATQVRYSIKRHLFGRRLSVRFEASAPVSCPEVLVVARPGNVQPLTREDGRVVGRCTGIDGKQSSREWPLDLGAVRAPAYLRAFFRHDDDYHRFSLVDPPVRELLHR